MNPLNHVAIIMDGNGRWGVKHKKSRNAGHKEGLNTVERIIKESIKQKIKFLTLYAFSTENWKRPKKEINYLFNLLEVFLINKIDSLDKQNIKLKIIGNKNFSPKLNKLLNRAEKKTIKRQLCIYFSPFSVERTVQTRKQKADHKSRILLQVSLPIGELTTPTLEKVNLC